MPAKILKIYIKYEHLFASEKIFIINDKNKIFKFFIKNNDSLKVMKFKTKMLLTYILYL